MSFNSCVRSLGLNKRLPIYELRALASEYEAGGMSSEEALRQVVRDKLQMALMEEANIIRTVREQWEAQGGAKRPAPEPAADPVAEQAAQPDPQAQAQPSPESEPAPQAIAEQPDDGADIPAAFFAKVKVPAQVLNEETGAVETVDVPADMALQSVNEDIANLQALIKCMKGGT